MASREQKKKIREASGSSSKSWSSNPQNRKETNPQDNKKVKSSTGPVMNYQGTVSGYQGTIIKGTVYQQKNIK